MARLILFNYQLSVVQIMKTKYVNGDLHFDLVKVIVKEISPPYNFVYESSGMTNLDVCMHGCMHASMHLVGHWLPISRPIKVMILSN